MPAPSSFVAPPAAPRVADAPPPAAGPPPRSGWRASPRFYVCVALLAGAAIGIQVAAKSLGHVLRKQAIPLRKPLAEADARKLGPEYSLHHRPPPPINHEVLQTLGTEEYLAWKVVDARRPRSDPLSTAHVFVTYYTGKPDMVPHVPEECYVAGGAVRVGKPQDVQLAIAGAAAPQDQVPLRALSFRPKASLRDIGPGDERQTVNVLYCFLTNGRYVTTRDGVRLAQANPFERYSYYAKIELRFTDYDEQRAAGMEGSIAASGPLLGKLLPILLHDHFPDWAAVTQPR